MTVTWQKSVAKARAGNLRAIEGRFTVALASFEQFPPHANPGNGPGRDLLDFANEIGMTYSTLTKYRSISMWWFESDPVGLLTEIGVPDHLAWEALVYGKTRWTLATDLRELLRGRTPANGRLFTSDELEVIARHHYEAPTSPAIAARKRVLDGAPADPPPTDPPADADGQLHFVYDRTVTGMQQVGDRMTRALTDLRDLELTSVQREQMRAAVLRAKAPLDFMLSYLDGGGSIEDWLAEREAETKRGAGNRR